MFRSELLRYVTFNAIIGNGDAHSKNYSTLISETGQIQLAPLYDVAPTYLLNTIDKQSGHTVNGKARLGALTDEDLIAERVQWGLRLLFAEKIVRDPIDRTMNALDEIDTLLALETLPAKAAERMLERFGATRRHDDADSGSHNSQACGTQRASGAAGRRGEVWVAGS